MRRIDSHVHAFPDRLALAVRERLNLGGRLEGSPLLPALADSVSAAGFDGAWVLPYAHRPGVAESVNEWSAAEVSKFEGLVPGATFHPGDDDLPRLVDRALFELRLRVVKLHCSVGQFSPSDSRLAPLWEAAAAVGAPVVVHAGQVGPGETAATEVDDLVPVLEHYPAVRLVLAHTGHPATARALELMGSYENLYGDLTPVWDRPVAVTAGDIRRYPDRFLFGSDAPNSPVPIEAQAGRLEALGLDASELALVMGGNAERLLA